MKRSPVPPALAAGLLVVFASWCGAAPVPGAGAPEEIAEFSGHGDIIHGLAFSPDGKLLASVGGGDGKVRVWDVEAGKCLHVLEGHGPRRGDELVLVTGVAFSPDGRTLATCGHDGTVRLWGASSGKAVAVLQPGGTVNSVQFSPDGKTLAWRSDQLHLWDLAAGKERGTFLVLTPVDPVYHFTPSGKLLGAGKDYAPPGFTVWDADVPDKGIPFRGHPKEDHPKGVMGLAFRADGKVVASCGYDKMVRIWDVSTAQELAALDQGPLWPGSVRFSPDGKVLAVGLMPDLEGRSKRGIIRLLDASSGKLLASLEDPNGRFGPFVFSPDGRLLAARYNDRTIKVWRLPEQWGTGK